MSVMGLKIGSHRTTLPDRRELRGQALTPSHQPTLDSDPASSLPRIRSAGELTRPRERQHERVDYVLPVHDEETMSTESMTHT